MEKITDRDQADQALRRLGEIERDLAQRKNAAEESIKKVRDRAKLREEPLKAEKKGLTARLEAWAKTDRKTWGGKSIKTKHGVLGFRNSSKLKLVKKAEVVLENLRARKLTNCIRTKDAVNKDLVKQLDPEVIKAVGCKLAPKDEFYANPAEEKA